MHTSNVWLVALCYALILKWYATSIIAATHNSQRFQGQQAKSPEALGKSWGWKKQQPPPQNNFIIITRPALSPALPVSPVTFPTSAVAVTTSFTTPTTAAVTTGRQGIYQNQPNPQNNRIANRYRNRFRNRNGNGNRPRRRRRRPLGHGVYYAREETDDHNEDNDDHNAGNTATDNVENKNSQGVNSKLDIGQLEKSLSPHQNHNKYKQINDNNENDYLADFAVSAEVADEVEISKSHSRKISKPQAMTTLPTTYSIEPIITTRKSKLPTYSMAAITNGHINHNNKKKNKYNNSNRKDDENDDSDGNSNRQTIWQGLTKRWRDRRKRRRNENNINNKKQQQEQLQQLQKIKTVKNNDNEIIIDENGKIHIQKNRKKQNNKNINRQPQQQQPDAAALVTEEEQPGALNSINNDKDTNSRFQNIINAFRRRTPIIYKNQR